MTIVLGTAWERDCSIAMDSDAVREMVLGYYELQAEKLEPYEVLIAAYWSGCYSGKGWLLLREKSTGLLYENNAEHCSCFELQGTFDPKVSSVAYLRSPMFPILQKEYWYDVTDADRKIIAEFVATL